MIELPVDRMPEAEVSIRLALFLAHNSLVTGDIDVAIDGAQVQNGDVTHFPIEAFLTSERLVRDGGSPDSWQARYHIDGIDLALNIHSASGHGDVVARLIDGRLLRIECKKGTLSRSSSSSEYPLIREAIGQIMTFEDYHEDHLVGIAVPHSEKFAELCTKWECAPLIQNCGILLLRVHRSGQVDGLPTIAKPVHEEHRLPLPRSNG